jgi:hypothetical protein
MVFLLFGCATLAIPSKGQYPFRAEFSAAAVINGEDIRAQGAMCLTSSTSGFAQIYGPGGLTVYQLTIQGGVLRVLDTWGRQVKQYSVPVKEIVGLLAGTPPQRPYLFKKHTGDIYMVTYTWGTLFLGEDILPREVHMRGNPRLDAFFESDGNILTLLIIYGSDRLHLVISIKEGGRWGFSASQPEMGDSIIYDSDEVSNMREKSGMG